jgi:glycosyltransferase involved in cell wall biosynthesis
MRILVSSPAINAYVRALVTELARRNLLDQFHTTIGFARRRVPLAPGLVASHPVLETLRIAAQRFRFGWTTRYETGPLSFDRVARNLDRAVSRSVHSQDAVYAYEDAAMETFRTAKERHICCVYELPIAYFEVVQRLCREEADRYPHWEPTLLATRDSAAKLDRKRAEMFLADLVVCPSQFVADSIPKEQRFVISPFGSPDAVSGTRQPVSRDRLRVLFAGTLSQRKGLADLFAAIRLVDRRDIEWVVLGTALMPLSFYRKQCPEFIYERPRRHREALALMSSCDILVLPSIVEGRALVLQEAMACGLPIIVTPNTGGSDLVVHGRTGCLVPIRSPESIAASILRLADDRPLLEYMSEQARRKAAEYTWSHYTNQIVQAIEMQVASQPSVG